jgi:hypothetical protein
MLLTRYLYDKAKVQTTLYHAILQKDYAQSAFWAYELYFSGFEEEVVHQLNEIYCARFKQNHRKLGVYFQKKQAELKGKPELIATLLKNLMKNPDAQETPGVKFINVKPYHIESFMTKAPKGPRWKFLREVCLYGVLGECSQTDLVIWRREWVSCGIHTPLWRERLQEYGDLANDSFVFTDEDKEEEFRNRWDYEPDEQPKETRIRCLGV